MNAVTTPASTALAPSTASAGALLMDMAAMDRLERIAELMSSGKTTVPQHLRGSKGDCFAIALQSMQWGMNPFAVGQKTHLVNGSLGYEAQLVAAVINNSGLVKDRFHFDWYGPWEKVIGKFAIKRGDKGEYRVPAWTMADEEGCGVRVWATLKGESDPRTLELLLAQARTRNSTLWADDPKQQLAYLAQKRWSRLYAPDVILGVYTPDELEPPTEKHMGPAELVTGKPVAEEPSYYPQADFDKNLEAWTKVVVSGRKTLQAMYAFVESKAKLSDAQKQALADSVQRLQENTIDATPKGEPQTANAPCDIPQIDASKLMAEMNAAQSLDALYERATLIDAITDPEQRKVLEQAFEAKKAELDPQ